MKHLSSRDLREIRRTACSVKGCELLIGPRDREGRVNKRRREKRHSWSEWVGRKGPDIVICFEEGA